LRLSLGAVIRAIRGRLGETGGTFGERLGVRQNTISQYESDKATPSTAVLLRLYQLAGTEDEKSAIRHELGDSAQGLLERERDFERLAGAVKKELDSMSASRAANPNARKRFADLILDVIRQPDVPLWLLDLLALWLEVKDEPDARQTFEDGFSGLWLRVAKLRREKRLAKSGAS
jgi:transcriptional regulator with XRE-family HTH domain